MFAGIVGALALSMMIPAKADGYVDPPSFGRIVYGMTLGQVVLPLDAWRGSYPDASGPVSYPGDGSFNGAASTTYAGDTFGTPGANTGYYYSYITGTLGQSVNASAVSGVFGGMVASSKVTAMKLGYVSTNGANATISVFSVPSVSTLTTVFDPTDAVGSLKVTPPIDNPFGLAYTSTSPLYAYYSDNPSNNTGTAANKLYNHIKAYAGTGDWAGYYFVGFEDVNFDSSGAGYHRFDFNDSVIWMTIETVPEPAFFQMAGLLSLGAFGLLRLRRRAS